MRAAGMGFTQVEGPRASGPPGPQASSWPPQPCELLLQLTLPISEATPLCARPHPTNQEHWRETDTSQKERRATSGRRDRTWKASQRRWLFNCSGSHLAFL